MASGVRRLFAFFGVLLVPGLTGGGASAGPWSATLYAGPYTNQITSKIVRNGDFIVDGGMIGLAVDRRLFRLGWGFSLGAEGQVTQYFGTYSYATVALGLGLRFDGFPWSDALPTSLAIYSGPSYAADPPPALYSSHTHTHENHLLNYTGIELAVAVPHHERHWDAVLRIYHRSGAWGVYSIDADEGSMIGLGIRAKF